MVLLLIIEERLAMVTELPWTSKQNINMLKNMPKYWKDVKTPGATHLILTALLFYTGNIQVTNGFSTQILKHVESVSRSRRLLYCVLK